MRIAYVEDNVTNLALVQRIATMSQHEVIPYPEGEIALLELSHQKFDLILMDIELAGEMNGWQVIRTLRARGLTTPIVAVTAYAMLGDREKCIEAGCNDYLPKPLPIPDFLALLARYDKALRPQPRTTEPVAAIDPILEKPLVTVGQPQTTPITTTMPPAAAPPVDTKSAQASPLASTPEPPQKS